MVETKAPTFSCSIERSTYHDEINALLAAGLTPNAIETKMRAANYPLKRETIKRHLERCLEGDPSKHANLDLIVRQQAAGAPKSVIERDFAIAVQREALKKLAKDELRVSTKDGLLAQQILDKRVEKAKDREFVMNLARIISGAGQMPPADVIEGEFTDEAVDEVLQLVAPPPPDVVQG